MVNGEEMKTPQILIGQVVRYSGRLGVIVGVSGNWIEVKLNGDVETVWTRLNELTFVHCYVYARS